MSRTIILVFLLLILFFVWKPYYDVINTPDPISYSQPDQQGNPVQFLKYDSAIYNKYLKPGEFEGKPQELDIRVIKAILKEKAIITILSFGLFGLLLILDNKFRFLPQ